MSSDTIHQGTAKTLPVLTGIASDYESPVLVNSTDMFDIQMHFDSFHFKRFMNSLKCFLLNMYFVWLSFVVFF